MSGRFDEHEGTYIHDEGTFFVYHHDDNGESQELEIDGADVYADAAEQAIEQHDIRASRIYLIQEQTKDYRETRWSRSGFIMYVNAYGVTVEDGGPEEGGWTYKAWFPVGSTPCLVQCAPTVSPKQALTQEVEKMREVIRHHPDIDDSRSNTSVTHPANSRVCIEPQMAEAGNNYHPYC
jgi:hypothetical protein